MQTLYRKLFEVEIMHDYFQEASGGNKFRSDYDIAACFYIIPSKETKQLLRDHRMVFKQTRTGYTVYVQAEPTTAPVGHATLVDPATDLVLSFYWLLTDMRFVNYTNHRLNEQEKMIYYFSNRTGSKQGSVTSLNQAIPAYGTTYPGATEYHLGDIVKESGQTFEMIDMKCAPIGADTTTAAWQKINGMITNYVNPFDRLLWKGEVYNHKRTNTNPGELIKYQLHNADGIAMPLQEIPGTGLLQDEYWAPVSASDEVDHPINFDHLPPGKYTLTINETGGPTLLSFYWLDEIVQPDLFAVSELFISGASAPFQFISQDAVSKRWMLDAPPKKFIVRFRNRLTRWKYLKQDQSVFHQVPEPRGLTKAFSNYTNAGKTFPDPSVDPIVPETDPVTRLLTNIYSQIYLNK
jgi:hypothetical protein